jgi:hypothetical protein
MVTPPLLAWAALQTICPLVLQPGANPPQETGIDGQIHVTGVLCH